MEIAAIIASPPLAEYGEERATDLDVPIPPYYGDWQ
jgi:hypothetical protein